MSGKAVAAFAALLVIGSIEGKADSRETVPFSRAGPWKIMVDRTVSNGCFAFGEFEAGTSVRVGWAPSVSHFYMIYGDRRWGRINPGNYSVKLDFDDGASVYTGTMKEVELAGNTVLMHENISSDFMIDFGKRSVLAVYNKDGSRLARLSLESSQQAINELVRCQKEMGA
jgi:hypothetical protein